MAAEALQSTKKINVDHRFHGRTHLLLIYEKLERSAGETFVEGLPPSTLHGLTRKMTFVPAGHKYCEWHKLRTSSHLIHFYFFPATISAYSNPDSANLPLTPRLFFEDSTVWMTAIKLKRLIESEASVDQIYFEALGAVLACELMRIIRGTSNIHPQVAGGLAAWQERALAAYISEHISDRIPLTTLARFVDLSPHHFCRAFKRSFGMPPHQYHTKCRIEQAKLLLAEPDASMTAVGLAVGFSSPSEFSRVFRQWTGLTPSAFHRATGDVSRAVRDRHV